MNSSLVGRAGTLELDMTLSEEPLWAVDDEVDTMTGLRAAAERTEQPRMGNTPTSVHPCSATNGTPRRDASSKANAVAVSEAGEPSMPTRTGASSRFYSVDEFAVWRRL